MRAACPARAVRLAAWGVLLALAACGGGGHGQRRPASPPAPPPPPSPPATVAPPPPPQSVGMSFRDAGTFVAHPDAIDPAILGQELRASGFGWAAIFVQDGTTAAPIDATWIERFRRASGLPLGGWGTLRTDPVGDADLAHSLVRRFGLDFYVANAEAEYGYTGAGGASGARYRRSAAFVREFRRLEPDLPAAVASYCRPDEHDLDWKAWSDAGFDFLPEAYVNDLGAAVAPAGCVAGAAAFFPVERVHPIVGMYAGRLGLGKADIYARLLRQAGTTGFSVYLAEQGMTEAKWAAFATAIARLGIAARPPQEEAGTRRPSRTSAASSR